MNLDYLDQVLDPQLTKIAKNKFTKDKRLSETVSDLLTSMGVSSNYRGKSDEMRDKMSAGITSIGIGFYVFVSVQVASFLSQPENQIKLAIDGFNFIRHMDELVVAWCVVDVIGLENLVGLGIDLGTWGIDIAEFSVLNLDLILDGAEMIGIGSEIMDAASTLGLSLLVSATMHAGFWYLNREEEKQLKELKSKQVEVAKLAKLLERGVPPGLVAKQLPNVEMIHWGIHRG